MARMVNTGDAELETALGQLEQGLRGEAIPAMLNAGGEKLKEAWKTSITQHHHVRTGAMLEAVQITEPKIEPDGASVEVYPEGTDSHRVTNAQKAFILHYGRRPNGKGRKEIKGHKFVTQAEKTARPEVDAAMQAKLNEYVAGKGL